MMSADETLRIDDSLKRHAEVVLPPPYKQSDEWPEPGGYASNAMYHLEAPGPLQQVWEQDAGKGIGHDVPPDRGADRRRRPHLCAGFRSTRLRVRRGDRQSGVGQASSRRKAATTAISSGCSARTTASIRPRASAAASPMTTARSSSTSGFGEVIALDAKPGKISVEAGPRRADRQCAGGQWRPRVRLDAGQSSLRAGRRPTAAGCGTTRASRNPPASWKAPARRWRAST